MRTIDDIKTEYSIELDKATETGKETRARLLRAELVNALTKGICTDRLETICNAERDGRLVEVELVKEGYNPKSIEKCGMIKRAMCAGAEYPPKRHGDQCDGYANSGGEPHEYCRACQFRSWIEDDEDEDCATGQLKEAALKGGDGE